MRASRQEPGEGLRRSAIPAEHLARLLIGAISISALGTFLLFVGFAGDEPFLSFGPREAVLHIGGGSVLFVTWCVIIIGICYGVLTHRLAPAWLLLLVVAGLGLAFSRACVVDYISDIVQKVIRR